MTSRTDTNKKGGPEDPLEGLVRLLARQAAREVYQTLPTDHQIDIQTEKDSTLRASEPSE